MMSPQSAQPWTEPAGPLGDHPFRNASRVGSTVVRAAQVAVLIGGGLFWMSVALLTHYVKNDGGESMLKAANSDSTSPLHSLDFKILIVLAALALIFTIISMVAGRPSLMIGAVITSLGLVGYTLQIPSEGAVPGFGPYGSSYWLSLGAAIAMSLCAATAAVAGLAARA